MTFCFFVLGGVRSRNGPSYRPGAERARMRARIRSRNMHGGFFTRRFGNMARDSTVREAPYI